MTPSDFFKLPVWFPYFASHSFTTMFVRLRPEAQAYLAASVEERKNFPKTVAKEVIADLRHPMSKIPGYCFTSTDVCAPTDTERFRNKGGAVYSPESAWKYLCLSEKIRKAAAQGDLNFICLRPYRHITKAREFRLFIYKGRLSAMSQYWLIRHYPLLDKKGKSYWEKAQNLADAVLWKLPVENFVMDVYITSDDEIRIIDLNPWGDPTDPLLLRSWEREDWEEIPGLQIMAPPTKISGDVHVSF
ncbi:MAG: hypothetical protein IKC65_09910 [Lentisphaeria bacterium]|nr:hypothetical protein [Lentisphaeria bacterium]